MVAIAMDTGAPAVSVGTVEPSRGLLRLLRFVRRSVVIWQCAFGYMLKLAFMKWRFARRADRDAELVAARKTLAANYTLIAADKAAAEVSMCMILCMILIPYSLM